MAISLKRKLYTRGSSFETTIPIQLLFSLDLAKKHNVLFEFDKEKNRWYVVFEEDMVIAKENLEKISTKSSKSGIISQKFKKSKTIKS